MQYRGTQPDAEMHRCAAQQANFRAWQKGLPSPWKFQMGVGRSICVRCKAWAQTLEVVDSGQCPACKGK